MKTFVIAFVAFVAAFAAMAVGAMFKKPRFQSACCGRCDDHDKRGEGGCESERTRSKTGDME